MILFFVAALFAEVIGTLAGFGSSTIFLPIALFFYDFKTSLVLVALFHVFGSIGRITFFRQSIHWKLLLQFGLPSVIFTIIGALLVNYISQPLLKLILGVFLVVFVVSSLWKPQLRLKQNNQNSFLGGGLSGFFAGLIGTGGAIRSAFLTTFRLEKAVYLSTAAVISLAVDLTRIPIYLKNDFLPRELFVLVPFLFLTAIVGSFIGKKLVVRIPQELFRKWVLVAIGMVSLKFIIDGILFFSR